MIVSVIEIHILLCEYGMANTTNTSNSWQRNLVYTALAIAFYF